MVVRFGWLVFIWMFVRVGRVGVVGLNVCFRQVGSKGVCWNLFASFNRLEFLRRLDFNSFISILYFKQNLVSQILL